MESGANGSAIDKNAVLSYNKTLARNTPTFRFITAVPCVLALLLLLALAFSQSRASEFETPYVTRAEATMVLLLTRLPAVPALKNNGRFADIQSGAWYEPYMLAAERFRIVQADPLRRLRPNQTINRAEFVKMMTYTFGLPQYVVHRYTDIPSDSWYASFAGIAYAYQLFPRSEPSPKFEPGKFLTHKEVSNAIQKLLNARGTNFPPLTVLSDARHAAAVPKPYLTISNLQDEVTIIHGTGTAPARAPVSEFRILDLFTGLRISDLRTEVLTLVNEQRAKAGLLPLQANINLQNSAQRYAEDMAQKNFFSHVGLAGETFRKRIEASGYYDRFLRATCTTAKDCRRTYALAENLARGQKKAADVVAAWMASTEHRKAILHPFFTDIGIGISSGYWVQHFGGTKN